MEKNFLGYFSPDNTDRWTYSAVYCYKIGGNCDNCKIFNLIKSQKCQMKACVLELIRKLGKPGKLYNHETYD
jgi:hypothetical protein